MVTVFEKSLLKISYLRLTNMISLTGCLPPACNLARGRPAFQSSLYTQAPFAVAKNAVDGNCNRHFNEGRSCTHTNRDLRPWWYVDLGSRYVISAVVVKNRGDCSDRRLRGAQIYVGDSVPARGAGNSFSLCRCGTITKTTLGGISTIYCNGFQGRYVSIVIPHRREYLSLCEVEVYGTRVGEKSNIENNQQSPQEEEVYFQAKRPEGEPFCPLEPMEPLYSLGQDGKARDKGQRNILKDARGLDPGSLGAVPVEDQRASSEGIWVLRTGRAECLHRIPGKGGSPKIFFQAVECGEKYLICVIVLLTLGETTPEVFQALKELGYTSFRPGQEAAVMRILSAHLSVHVACFPEAGRIHPLQRRLKRAHSEVNRGDLPALLKARSSDCWTTKKGSQATETRMTTLWTWLSALALLVGAGASQSCRPELQGIGSNLARGRPAFQSSLFTSDFTEPSSALAGNAVDGNCDGHWYEGRSCSHTKWELDPWWYVDLGSQHIISTVVVKNRGDCCGERIRGAQIYVGDSAPAQRTNSSLCGTITDTTTGSISTFCCNGFKGRYVSIVISGRKEFLHVCEVEVYGARVADQCWRSPEARGNASRSSDCQTTKKGSQATETRMPTLWTWLSALALLVGAGASQSCRPELQGIGSNLARGRPAFQSSLYTETPFSVAGNAVDGNCNGDFNNGRSCTHTNLEPGPWWYVDLGSRYVISTVVVKNRGDCCNTRLSGAQIHVGDSVPVLGPAHSQCNSLCGTITGDIPGGVSTIYCRGLKGRYVSIFVPHRNEYLSLCEVEVYGTLAKDQC
ncbi:uncharacterized protein LOC110084815 [Pogona vitticeps]